MSITMPSASNAGHLIRTVLAVGAVVAGVSVATHSRYRLVEARRQLAAAEHAATHDPLTGLLNRDGLTQAWPMLAPAGPVVALLDLDGFKPVNDQHGHAAGDVVLCATAQRLHRLVHGLVARLGGDEFAAVLLNPHSLPGIAAEIAEPVILPSGATVRVTASIGTSHSDDDLAAALERADAAMYRAKTTNTGTASHDPHRDDHPTSQTRPAIRVRDLTNAPAPASPAVAR